MHTLPCVKQIASGKLLYDTGSSARCFDDLDGGRKVGMGGKEAQEGGDICIPIADSYCCTAESNTL